MWMVSKRRTEGNKNFGYLKKRNCRVQEKANLVNRWLVSERLVGGRKVVVEKEGGPDQDKDGSGTRPSWSTPSSFAPRPAKIPRAGLDVSLCTRKSRRLLLTADWFRLSSGSVTRNPKIPWGSYDTYR